MTSALAEDVGDDNPVEDVERAVDAATKRYEDAPVREFVPILVERAAREELRDPEDDTSA